MKLVLVLALCAVGLVSSRIPSPRWLEEVLPESRSFEDSVFRSGREYRFVYNGQLLTGIPSSSKQHSGSRVQGLVSLIFKTEREAVLKITNFRMGKVNRRLPNPREILPFMLFEETPIQEELKAKLEAPVKFTYNKGLISNLVFDGIEQPWSANIKRGVLNLLQVNLQKRNLVDFPEESLSRNEIPSEVSSNMDFFSVMEPTLEGECETLYTVVSEPSRFHSSGPVMNVTKSINFENCQKRPEVKYNFRFQDPCPTCNSRFNSDEKFLKTSSVFKYNISGTPESFLIERANVESQYVVVPFNEEGNVIVTYVNQTLVLFKSGPIETRVSEISSPIRSDSHMIYTPDWDILKEKFFMEGEEQFHSKTPYSSISNKVEFVASIIRNLISSVRESVEDPAPRYFDHLVKVFRILKRQDIERVWMQFFVEVPEDFTPEQHKKIKSFIVDAIAFAGTKDNVFFLVQKIKSRQVSPFMASLAVKSFVNIRAVSKEMIEELLTLGESEVCQRNWFLRQSVYLTVGSMMNALCSPNQDVLAWEFKLESPQRKFCPRQLKQRYVETLFTKFRSSESWEHKVLFLKTISNAGLDLSIFELEKIIKNVEVRQPAFIRFEAVLALNHLHKLMPRKVQKILMPIYMNRNEAPEMRIACAYQIFQTLPERPILDQIAKRLFSDPSRQVASFVFTYMNTMANSTVPCERKFAEDLKLALRHSRYPSFSFLIGYSQAVHKSFFSQKYNVGLGMSFYNHFSNASYFPKHLGVTFHPVLGGFWSKRFLGFGVGYEGFENLFWKYFGDRGYFFEKPLDEVVNRYPRSVDTVSPVNELKSMFQSLRIRPREYFPNRPRGMFYMKYKDQEFAFLPFSLEHLPEDLMRMVESGRFNIRHIEQILKNGYHFQFYKAMLAHEMSYKIPTTLGFPLSVEVTVPTVMSLTGEAKVEFTPETSFRKIKISLKDVKPSFVSTWFTNVQSWSPVVNSGMKVIAKAKFFYPITGHMEMDFQKTPKELKLSFQLPTRQINAFSLETRPVTYTFVWPQSLRTWVHPEEKTIMGEEWTRISKYEKSFGSHLFGVNFKIRSHWHKTPFMKQVDTPFCPLSGPNKFVFLTEPGHEMPKEWVLKLTGQLFKPLSEPFRPEFREFEPIEESVEPLNLQNLKSFVPSEPRKHQIKVEFFSKDSTTPRRFVLENFINCGVHMKFCKLSTHFERTPMPSYETQPFKFCFDGETLFPSAPMSFNELVGKKAVAQFKVRWGQSCSNSEKFLRLNVIGERSQKQIHHEKFSPEFQLFSEEAEDKTIMSPVFQYEHLYKFAQLLHYKFDLEYSQVPVAVKNYTNFFYRYLKYYYFPQTDVAQIDVRNPQNKIRAFLTLDPKSQQYFNFTVKTPFENTRFTDIPMNPMYSLRPVNVRQTKPLFSLFDSIRHVTPFVTRPTCSVSSHYIKTFDSVKYSVPLTTCWTVLAKDCGSVEEPNFGVFMKKLNPESELKKIKIVTPYHRFFLVPEGESFDSVKIEFNGQKFTPEDFQPVMHHEHVVARVEKLGTYIKFVLPETGLKVFFDGYTVNMKLSQFYRNVQCGLCGHFDREMSDEFRLPSNELTNDVREFYRSYIIPEESCSVPEISEICTSLRCEDHPEELTNYGEYYKDVIFPEDYMSGDDLTLTTGQEAFDGIASALHGYDRGLANPNDKDGDPGWRGRIFQPGRLLQDESGNSFKVSPRVKVSQTKRCTHETNKKMITSWNHYKENMGEDSGFGYHVNLGNEVEVEGNIGKEGVASVGLSTKIPPFARRSSTNRDNKASIKEFFEKEQGALVSMSAKCITQRVDVEYAYGPTAPFEESFQYAMRALVGANKAPRERQRFEARRFIDTYGTHFSRRTQMGAKMVFQSRFTAKERKDIDSKTVMECSEIQGLRFLWFQLEKDSKKCESFKKHLTEFRSSSVGQSYQETWGSKPTKDAGDWANQGIFIMFQNLTQYVYHPQVFTPIPLTMELVPIVNLWNSANFKELGITNEQDRKDLIKWFLPLYAEYCTLMPNADCTIDKSICGISSSCRFNEECVIEDGAPVCVPPGMIRGRPRTHVGCPTPDYVRSIGKCAIFYENSHQNRNESCSGRELAVSDREKIPNLGDRKYAGWSWNDEISGMVVASECRVIAYVDSDYRGQENVFTGDGHWNLDTGFVDYITKNGYTKWDGRWVNWNDKFSSLECIC